MQNLADLAAWTPIPGKTKHSGICLKTKRTQITQTETLEKDACGINGILVLEFQDQVLSNENYKDSSTVRPSGSFRSFQSGFQRKKPAEELDRWRGDWHHEFQYAGSSLICLGCVETVPIVIIYNNTRDCLYCLISFTYKYPSRKFCNKTHSVP